MTLTVHGGCIQGSPSICMGRAFIVLQEKVRFNHKDYLHSAGGLCACECGYTRITFAIFMHGTHDDTIQAKTGALNVWFSSLLCVFMLRYGLTQVNCVVFFLCILTWWWFEKSEPVYARRSSAPCRSVPSQWPLPTPPPPSACRLYLWSDVTHHSGTRQSQKRRAKTSRNLSGLTLWDCFEKFRVRDDPNLLHLWWTIRFLGFTPEVGATVHAGYVEDSYALQRYVAEVQGSPTTLAEAKQKRKGQIQWPKKIIPLASDLNHKTVLQLFAGGKDGLRGGELKIPKFVLHPEMSRRKWIVLKHSERREPIRPVRQTSHLLLNLWGCLSLMEWKRWAIEASCKHGHKWN